MKSAYFRHFLDPFYHPLYRHFPSLFRLFATFFIFAGSGPGGQESRKRPEVEESVDSVSSRPFSESEESDNSVSSRLS